MHSKITLELYLAAIWSLSLIGLNPKQIFLANEMQEHAIRDGEYSIYMWSSLYGSKSIILRYCKITHSYNIKKKKGKGGQNVQAFRIS
jgi:hypothetical protein